MARHLRGIRYAVNGAQVKEKIECNHISKANESKTQTVEIIGWNVNKEKKEGTQAKTKAY